jgi:hypothetical protein
MKRFALPTVLTLSALSLGACATGSGGPMTAPQVDTGQVGQVISQVQNTAVKLCGIEPTIATVASIIGTFTGVPVGGITAVADGICKAVASVPKLGRRGAVRPTYRGVVIHYRRVG